MHSMTLNKRGSKIVVTARTMFHLFFALWWMRDTVLVFFRPIIAKIPFFGIFKDWLIPVIMVGALLLAITHIVRNIRYKDLTFYLLIAFLVLGTMLFLPENSEFIEPDLWRIFGVAIPAYFLGVCYDHKEMKNLLCWCSLIVVFLMSAYQMYKMLLGRVIDTENMYLAYNVLPSVLYMIYWAFEQKKIQYRIASVLGIILVLSLGTRGAVLVILAYLAVQLFIRLIWQRKGIWRVLGTVLLAVVLSLLFTTNAFEGFIAWLSETFGRAGLSTRVFDAFLEGEFVESAGRERLAQKTLVAISEKPLLGLGFYGDRVASGESEAGNYAHNLVLELWCQFGVVLGTGILLAIIWLIVSALRRVRRGDTRDVYLLFVCLILVKLMVSGSYAIEPYFFFMIGMAVRIRRDARLEVDIT